jgi:hypothetical protein
MLLGVRPSSARPIPPVAASDASSGEITTMPFGAGRLDHALLLGGRVQILLEEGPSEVRVSCETE